MELIPLGRILGPELDRELRALTRDVTPPTPTAVIVRDFWDWMRRGGRRTGYYPSSVGWEVRYYNDQIVIYASGFPTIHHHCSNYLRTPNPTWAHRSSYYECEYKPFCDRQCRLHPSPRRVDSIYAIGCADLTTIKSSD